MMRHIILLDGNIVATIEENVLRMTITAYDKVTKHPTCTVRKHRCQTFPEALRRLTALEQILNDASGAFATELLTRMNFTSEFGVVQPLTQPLARPDKKRR